MRKSRHWPAVLVFVPLLLVLWAQPVSASLTGPCHGIATIEGVPYGPGNDTPGNPVVLPNRSGVVVDYRASTDFPIHDYTGQVAVDLGSISIVVADFTGKNERNHKQKSGTYELDKAYAKLPFDIVGIYKVTGFYHGTEAACTGFVYVKFEGNPLTTVPGAAAAVLTLGSLAGVALAGFARRSA